MYLNLNTSDFRALSKAPMLMPSSTSHFFGASPHTETVASSFMKSSSSLSSFSSFTDDPNFGVDNQLAAGIARIGCMYGSSAESTSSPLGATMSSALITCTSNSSCSSSVCSFPALSSSSAAISWASPQTTDFNNSSQASPLSNASSLPSSLSSSAFSPSTSSLQMPQHSTASDPTHHRSQHLHSPSSSISSSAAPTPPSCVRINGRKVFGPPDNWTGDPPPISAELYVKGIPRGMNEHHLHALFRRYGAIYCVRLMVDYNDQNRGFGYVHYTSVSAADRALYAMQHCYVQPNVRLHLERSYDKCRLFVSKLPKHLRVNTVRQGLHDTFPEVKSVVVYHAGSTLNGSPSSSSSGGDPMAGNRGFAFLEFPTHDAAIRAKQLASTGQMRIFGQNVHVVWANPERAVSEQAMRDVRTLFVRNVDMRLRQADLFAIITQFVAGDQVRRVSRNRDLAFVELRTREAAQRLLECLDGYVGMYRAFDVQWSIPANHDSLHGGTVLAAHDHDAALRLVCVANEWFVPVYLFGRVCTMNMAQYVCVLLAASSGGSMVRPESEQERCALIMELQLTGVDLQTRAAEVVMSLVRRCGRLPQQNYVLVVEANVYHIVGRITDLAAATFQRAATPTIAPPKLSISIGEVSTLSRCAAALLAQSRSQLQRNYELALQQPMRLPPPPPGWLSHAPVYLPAVQVQDRIFGCVNPMYRKQAPLRHGLDMGQMVLVACEARSGRNFHINHVPMLAVNVFERAHMVDQMDAAAAFDVMAMPYECVQLDDADETAGGGNGGEERPVDEHFVVFFGMLMPPVAQAEKQQQQQQKSTVPM